MTFDFARGSEPEVAKIVDEVEGKGEIEADKDEVELEEGVLSEDRFRRGGLDLLHSVAYQSIDLYQSIEDSHRREEYAREHAHIVEKFNKKWQKKEQVRPLIPTTVPDEIRPKENCGFTPTRGTRRMTTLVLELDGKVVLLASSERGLYRRVLLFGVTWLARRPVPNSDEGLNTL